MRRAILSACTQSYGIYAQSSTTPASLSQSLAAPVLGAHTQATGANPGTGLHAHGPASTQTGADSPKPSTDTKKTSRWRIVDSSDLRSVNKSNGKLVDFSSTQLIPALTAKHWPAMRVSSHARADEEFSQPLEGTHARIVLASYRASAEMYLSEWRNVITESFQDHADVELVELTVCDVAICKVWPFKGMLVNATKAPHKTLTALSKMSARRVHYFGDDKVAVEGLGMSNRLTGYVFLVDEDGRVRWQASGRMLEEEAHNCLRAVRGLLGARKRDTGRDSEYEDEDSFS
eukprot:jgi/Ulvmu1/3114/UM015_0154.1